MILSKRSWMFPVSEPICVLLGIASNHSDEGEEEEHENQQNFAAVLLSMR